MFPDDLASYRAAGLDQFIQGDGVGLQGETNAVKPIGCHMARGRQQNATLGHLEGDEISGLDAKSPANGGRDGDPPISLYACERGSR